MAVGMCLLPEVRDKFKAALVNGKITPERLHRMTTEERTKLLTEVVGEGNAKFVNREYESKLLLKNEERGVLNWAKKFSGADEKMRTELQTKIKAEYARKQQRLYNPNTKGGEVPLEQLVHEALNRKYKVEPTTAQADKIIELHNEVDRTEARANSQGIFRSEADRMAYGRALADLGSYIGEAKLQASKTALRDVPKNTLLHPVQSASKLAGFQKSIKAAFDDSALLRQNWKVLLTHPGMWAKNARKNIDDLKKQGIQGKDVMREATADVMSRPNAMNGMYKKLGIEPKIEEEFGDPTLITKIPGIGRLYKTTEVAFNALMLRTRADLADYYIDLAKKINEGTAKLSAVKAVDLENPKELASIGKMLGGMTGRGDLGAAEKVANTTNNIFFSPRFVKSQIDTVLHPISGAGGSNFVRQEAAKNLIKIVAATAALFTIADMIAPGSVELDPRSSKFGKLKVGDTTFDLTGGFSAIAVLAARLKTQQLKSGKGTISPLGHDPGQVSGEQLFGNFITGKLSPAAQRAWVNLVTKQEYNGAKPSTSSNLLNAFEPLPSSTYREAKGDPHGANPIVTEIADALGLSANTTNPATQVKQLGKTDTAFKAKIGDKKFQDFNNSLNDKLTTFTQSDYYKQLPNDQKQSEYTYKEGVIKKNLYKQYDFTPPKAASTKNQHRATANASPN